MTDHDLDLVAAGLWRVTQDGFQVMRKCEASMAPDAATSAPKRLVGLRWGGWNHLDLSNLSVPRIRLYDGEDDLLVNVCIGDGRSDPVVGVDFYVTGRVGEAWSGWLWERRRRASAKRRSS